MQKEEKIKKVATSRNKDLLFFYKSNEPREAWKLEGKGHSRRREQWDKTVRGEENENLRGKVQRFWGVRHLGSRPREDQEREVNGDYSSRKRIPGKRGSMDYTGRRSQRFLQIRKRTEPPPHKIRGNGLRKVET